MKTDPHLQGLISELKKQAALNKVNIWKRIAVELESPTRRRRIVNLYKLSKYSKENEVVIVPGKVLGTGDVEHKITVAALSYSQSAVDKLEKSKSTIYTISDLLKNNPKGKNVRIIG